MGPELYAADYVPVLPADQVVWVDTTDFDAVDIESAATQVQAKLARHTTAVAARHDDVEGPWGAGAIESPA